MLDRQLCQICSLSKRLHGYINRAFVVARPNGRQPRPSLDFRLNPLGQLRWTGGRENTSIYAKV